MYEVPSEEYTATVKVLVRLGIVLFGLLSLLALSLSLYQARSLYSKGADPEDAEPTYHFSLYLPDTQNSFFDAIVAGARNAAVEVDAVLSLHSIDPSRGEFEMAAYTGVDGVVVCPYLDDKTARRQLEKLSANGIPLVIMNHNVPTDAPWPYIGANNFDVGRKMGSVARRVAGSDPHLAVVYSDKSPGIYAERELVEMGIRTAMGNLLKAPLMSLKTNRNPLDAEAMTYRLLRSSPEINAIIFTDANDTIAAAQVLIDMNLVGHVQIVGFGDEESILEYIRKGIVAATIAVNPEKIGYDAVKSLASLCSTGYTSTSIDTGVEIVDRGSL